MHRLAVRRAVLALVFLLMPVFVVQQSARADTKTPRVVLTPAAEGLVVGPGMNAAGRDLRGCEFVGQDLTGANFDGCNLYDVRIHDCILKGASFRGAIFSGAQVGDFALDGLDGADFTDATINGMGFSRGQFFYTLYTLYTLKLSPEQLMSTRSYKTKDLRQCMITGAWAAPTFDFRGAHLKHAVLANGDFTKCDFSGARIRGVKFRDFTLAFEQLASTADFRRGRLCIHIQGGGTNAAGLTGGWNFSGIDLEGSNFYVLQPDANFTNARINGCTSNLNIYTDKQKTELTNDASVPPGTSEDWYYWTISSGSVTLPNEISNNDIGKVFVEGVGITTTDDEVFWRLVKPNGYGYVEADILARDTVEINVEKIVWPSNESGGDWQDNPTTEWDGFVLADTWYIEESLCRIINGNVGYIHTPFPKETSEDVWEGVNRSDATIQIPGIPTDPEDPDFDDPFHIEIIISYQFDGSMPHSDNNYVDADNGEIKPGFFANSGIYIDNKCEIQIYDTKSLLDAIDDDCDVIIDGDEVTVDAAVVDGNKNPDQDGEYVLLSSTASGTHLKETINALITGIAYGTGSNTKARLDAAPQGSGSLTIDVERKANGKYDIKVDTNGDETWDNTYTDLEGTGSGLGRSADGKIHLQSHKGSGVIFTAATVTIVEE